MKCPHCDEFLVMTERQGIEIDYCPKCRGVWLDKGELDKLIERSETPPQQGFDRRDNYKDDDYEKRKKYEQGHRKKGGFLGNLFDFD